MSQQSGNYPIGSSTFQNVPRPTGNNLTFFLNSNDRNRLYVMNSKGEVKAVYVNSDNIPFGNDTNAAANTVTVTVPNSVPLVDGYTFQVRILTTNTGAVVMNLNGIGNKAVVDTSGSALVAGDLVSTSIYLFYYDLSNDRYVSLGLAPAFPGSALTDTHIFVGNASNVPTDVAVSKDITMANTGAATVVGIQGTTVIAGPYTTGTILYYDGTFWQTLTVGSSDDVLTVSAGVPSWGPKLPYKVWSASVTQAGTSAPTSSILENTLGALVWSYNAVGSYDLTLAAAFPTASKVQIFIGQNMNTTIDYDSYGERVDANTITFSVVAYDDHSVYANDIWKNIPIEIRVWP